MELTICGQEGERAVVRLLLDGSSPHINSGTASTIDPPAIGPPEDMPLQAAGCSHNTMGRV